MTALGIALVGLVGAVDYLTGYELSFSIFYLLPITLVAWFASRWTGFFLCATSAIVWLLVDYTSGHDYSHGMILIWNATVRLGLFLVTAYLLDTLKIHLRREEVLARTDGLTRVLNSRGFEEVFHRLFQLAARYDHSAVLGYMDVDNFKAVNDDSGHSEGDRVLQTVAGILTRSVRRTDVVGRLGGDEFAVLMPEVGYAAARIVFDKMHRELVQCAATRGWPIGFSIGVAVFPSVPSTTDEALRIADRLMYEAKETGKNKVIYHEQVESDGDPAHKRGEGRDI